MIIVKLKPWDERTAKEDQVQAVVNQIYARTADIKDATVFAIAPGMIPGYGMGNALDLNVQDKQGGDMNTFFQTTQQYLAALNQRPEISMAYSTFDVRYPQWTVEVDASKCKPCRDYSRPGVVHTVGLLWRAICLQLQPFLQSLQGNDSGRPEVPFG